jgi:hypothetical protein
VIVACDPANRACGWRRSRSGSRGRLRLRDVYLPDAIYKYWSLEGELNGGMQGRISGCRAPDDPSGQSARRGAGRPDPQRRRRCSAAASRTCSRSSMNVSGDALKAARRGTRVRVRSKQTHLGEGHEETMRLAFRAKNDQRASAVEAETVWKNPETRSEAELGDAMVKLRSVGWSFEKLAEEFGYSPEEIKQMIAERGLPVCAAAGRTDFEPRWPATRPRRDGGYMRRPRWPKTRPKPDPTPDPDPKPDDRRRTRRRSARSRRTTPTP